MGYTQEEKKQFISDIRRAETLGLADLIDLYCFELDDYDSRDKLHEVMNDYIEMQRAQGFKSICLDPPSANELTVITFFKRPKQVSHAHTVGKSAVSKASGFY